MTAAIDPIGALSAVGGLAPITPIDTGLDGGTAAVNPSGGQDFAAQLGGAIQNVQDLQSKTDDLSVQAATGSLTDVHDYMIASAESGIATQLTTAVRNKAVEAFQEIMRMQA